MRTTHREALGGGHIGEPDPTPVTLQDVFMAQSCLRGWVRHTPLEHSFELSRHAHADVWMKLENTQVTGSFKVRGPFNRLQTLTPEERHNGVVASTAGNHGIGLAYAAKQLGIAANIYLPDGADPSKVRVLESYDARLSRFPGIEDARQAAMNAANQDGLVYVSAYSDPAVIAGNGTIGLEILADMPDVEVAVVCVGGGGLVSGIGAVLKAVNPSIEIWGVEAGHSPTFSTWYRAGRTVEVPLQPSIAEGLSGYIEPETLTWPVVRRVVDRMLGVSDEEMVSAMRWAMEYHRYMLEPSGAAALAVVLRAPAELRGRRVAITLSGRNVSLSRLMTLTGYERRV